jgi:deoxyribonuclease V
MFVVVDVHYVGTGAVVGCVYGEDPRTAVVLKEWRHPIVGPIAAYEPGAFYKRELPCLMAALALDGVDLVVIDGHVWLKPAEAGLGYHLFQALGGAVPVLGIAKTSFTEGTAEEVSRSSTRPLYVTSVGLPVGAASQLVKEMHGPYRLPTLVKRADTLCRIEKERT